MTFVERARPANPDPAATPERVLRLGSPDDVLARIPFLLGFHPRESLVVLGFVEHSGRQRMLRLTSRFDLPPESVSITETADYTAYVTGVHARNSVRSALLVAYSESPSRARRSLRLVRRAMAEAGIEVSEALRADGRRWWTENASTPERTRAGGTPYDLSTHPVTAEAVYDGEIALADEAELTRSVEPILGLTRVGMLAATGRVQEEVERRFCAVAGAGGDAALGVEFDADGFAASGLRYVTELLTGWLAQPRRLTDQEVAWTATYLRHLTIRDEAWAMMDRAAADDHVRFWRDVARRAVPPYDVAPMTLLAFAAWLSGNGALALRAVERALAADSDYGLARIVKDVLAAGIPPSEWTPHPRVSGGESIEGASNEDHNGGSDDVW